MCRETDFVGVGEFVGEISGQFGEEAGLISDQIEAGANAGGKKCLAGTCKRLCNKMQEKIRGVNIKKTAVISRI